MYYYKNSAGAYTVRSAPLVCEGETEVTEDEYNNYISAENKKHEKE